MRVAVLSLVPPSWCLLLADRPELDGYPTLAATLPDDPFARRWATRREECSARRWGLLCTRLEQHTGRHAASDGMSIVAVWP